MNIIENLIEKLPKAELHLHIEGTLEPSLLLRLAKKNHIAIPYSDVDSIKKAYQFTNLQSFLDLYYMGANVLQKEEDFYLLTLEYLEKAKQDNIRHVEIFFDPQTHLARNIELKVVIQGITRALEEGKSLGITSGLILCFLRHLSAADAMQTFEQALPYQESIVAVGLDSGEKNNPPKNFQAVFERALKEGFKTVAHAGEEGPPSYIKEALDLLKVSRIDHGVRCLEDEKVVQELKEKQIPLTVCPLSNIKLCVFKELQAHPLKKMLNKGLLVTVNSDDPAYFGGYLNDNFSATKEALHLTQEEIYLLLSNSFRASFIPESLKNKYLKVLEETYHSLILPTATNVNANSRDVGY